MLSISFIISIQMRQAWNKNVIDDGNKMKNYITNLKNGRY